MSAPEARDLAARHFDYELPPELIAQRPAERRAAARLLHLPASGDPRHLIFNEFPGLLRPGDLLVLNETRVIPARLRVHRASGGAVEVFLVRPGDGDWSAMIRPARRIRRGERLVGADGAFTVVVEEIGDTPRVRLEGAANAEILERHGEIPLPPYIDRPATPEDRERYQTVFARLPGAVAAPTAGLHFEDATLDAVRERSVSIARLVLHVGPGTFRPLPDDVPLSEHVLDHERYEVGVDVAGAIADTRRGGGRVVAVGTTVVRSLESWARAGSPSAGIAGQTDLFIRPPFDFQIVDAMVTNFHLPRSSLMCLVAAFAGRSRILSMYAEAVRERYRFYSYGDATFLERSSETG